MFDFGDCSQAKALLKSCMKCVRVMPRYATGLLSSSTFFKLIKRKSHPLPYDQPISTEAPNLRNEHTVDTTPDSVSI